MAAPIIPAFRFNPTDDEIIRLYLIKKILGRPNPNDIVTTEDVYDTSPMHLPLDNSHGHFNDNEWYFYTTRTSQDQYWTRNGYYITADSTEIPVEEILYKDRVVGSKRLLRFYLGKFEPMKTDYYVHEFQFDPNFFPERDQLDNDVQQKLSTLVMCRIMLTKEFSDNEY